MDREGLEVRGQRGVDAAGDPAGRAVDGAADQGRGRLARGPARAGEELRRPRDDEDRADRLILLREAREVQERVRARVDPAVWEGFWLTAIEDRPTSEVAASLGKSYAAVYYGSRRVAEMLRREGERRLGHLRTRPEERA